MFNTLLATVIFSTWYPATQVNICCCIRYLHRHSVFTPTPDTLYLIYNLWLRHSIFTLALGIYTGTWYLIPVPRHLIFRHRYSIYVILDTWSWHPVYDILSCGTSTLTWHCDPWPDTTIPDTCIIWHIHDYHFYGDLTWLLYYYQTFGTPELLYTWTPEIGKLLTLLLNYTPVDPRNRITMDIGLLWIPCGLYYLTLYYI